MKKQLQEADKFGATVDNTVEETHWPWSEEIQKNSILLTSKIIKILHAYKIIPCPHAKSRVR